MLPYKDGNFDVVASLIGAMFARRGIRRGARSGRCGDHIRQFADFMRATKAPPRGSISATDDQAGLAIFSGIGCGTCHVATIVTAPTGTAINGGAFRVPPALGSKTIHPFNDFLLHDVGTHDPIVQNGGTDTYNKVRTPPLWGLRIRTRSMHDCRVDLNRGCCEKTWRDRLLFALRRNSGTDAIF